MIQTVIWKPHKKEHPRLRIPPLRGADRDRDRSSAIDPDPCCTLVLEFGLTIRLWMRILVGDGLGIRIPGEDVCDFARGGITPMRIDAPPERQRLTFL